MKLYSNEIVFRGHPDKVCDQISNAILDKCLRQDKNSRCGIEVVGGKGKIFITGEVTTNADIIVELITKRVLQNIGCNTNYEIINNLGKQSPDIAQGVDTGGAGDNGMMFGYACNDNDKMLPTAMVILQEFAEEYDNLIQTQTIKRFLPDGKAQITGEYNKDFKLIKIKNFTICYQNTELEREYTDKILTDIANKICDKYGVSVENYLINPTGKFLIGGFEGDSGLCLNEETLVSTISGLRKIKDLKKGMTVYTESGKADITEVINNGVKNTKIIKDHNGVEIEATLNHPFRCWDGENIVWKHCGELKEGDVLIKRKIEHMNTHGRDVKDIIYNKKGKDIKIKFDEDFAYLLGWLVGDGNTTANDRITFYYGSDLEKEHIYKKLIKCFPAEEIKNYEYQDDRYYILSKPLLNELDKIGVCFKTSRFKRVPTSILRSTDKIKCSFLAGLFDADGHISEGDGRDGEYLTVSLSTTSNILSQEVSILLYSLGIQSTIGYIKPSPAHYKKDGCFVKSSDGYYVRITGLCSIRKFLTKSGFDLSYKEVKYKNKEFAKKWYYNDDIRFNIVKILKPLLLLNTYKYYRYFENYVNPESFRVDRWYLKENLDEILDLYAEYKDKEEYKRVENVVKNFEFVKIKSIKDGSSNTFDISLDDETHSFIANGFIVHNTGRKIVVDAYQGFANVGGGCVDYDTEFLSLDGWKKIGEYVDGDKVAQWTDGELEFVTPIDYIKTKAEDMYRIKTSQNIDMVLSENHNVLYRTSKKNWNKKKLKDILYELDTKSQGSRTEIPLWFNNKFTYSNGIDLTDEEIKLQVAFCADGSILDRGRNEGRIRIKKDYKIKRITDLLDNSNIDYRISEDKEYKIFWFNPPILNKSLFECFKNCNRKQAEVIANEVVLWDGNRKNMFRTTIKKDADFIQFIFSSVFNTSISITLDDRVGEIQNSDGKEYIRKSICYCVTTKKNKYSSCFRTKQRYSSNLSIVPFFPKDNLMYCFNVPSHNLILRNNNNIYITGNCFNGKDPSKVDMSGAYKARQIACDMLKKHNLKWCEVQLSYSIGIVEPMAIYITSDIGEIEADDTLYIECQPNNIIKDLGLKEICYEEKAKFGHFR